MTSYPSSLQDPDAPIGVFDSGIGGLTVANAVRQRMPEESLLYFGDTAHLPYGDKSAASIRHYSELISARLLEQGCKAIVVACNTASSYAHYSLMKKYGARIPVVDVIDPVAAFIASHHPRKRIGLIGTKGTISSRVYLKRIRKAAPHATVLSRSTPLLAPMIEEGFFDNRISRTIISSYLSDKKLKGIDALVLGCTHYPLIKQEIEEYYEGRVEVIDPSILVADALKKALEAEGLSRAKGKPEHRFFVSDYTEAFARSTRLFFGKKVRLQEWRIWEGHSPYQDA